MCNECLDWEYMKQGLDKGETMSSNAERSAMKLDRTTERPAQEIVSDLVTKGGGTYERSTLLPFEPADGYAVGIGGIKLPVAQVTADSVAWALRNVGSEFDTVLVGTWESGGYVHFDAVRYFAAHRKEAALTLGWQRGQQAIYDFGGKVAVEVTYKEYEA